LHFCVNLFAPYAGRLTKVIPLQPLPCFLRCLTSAWSHLIRLLSPLVIQGYMKRKALKDTKCLDLYTRELLIRFPLKQEHWLVMAQLRTFLPRLKLHVSNELFLAVPITNSTTKSTLSINCILHNFEQRFCHAVVKCCVSATICAKPFNCVAILISWPRATFKD